MTIVLDNNRDRVRIVPYRIQHFSLSCLLLSIFLWCCKKPIIPFDITSKISCESEMPYAICQYMLNANRCQHQIGRTDKRTA